MPRRDGPERVTVRTVDTSMDDQDGWIDSRRPIRRVAPRVVYDGRTVWPDGFRTRYVGVGFPGRAETVQWLDSPESEFDLSFGEYRNLLADAMISAQFTIPWVLEDQQGLLVVEFHDDEDRRWELDQNMHLAPAPDLPSLPRVIP
jgi:hypothetical protein